MVTMTAEEIASCFAWGTNDETGISAYYATKDCGRGLSAILYVKELQLNDTGYNQQQALLQQYMYSQTVVPAEIASGAVAAWGDLDMFFFINFYGFVRMCPFYDLMGVSFDVLVESLKQIASLHTIVWSSTMQDPRNLNWNVRLYIPAYDDYTGLPTPPITGACGFQIDISAVNSYTESLSNNLPYEAYAVVVSGTGTLLAIPERGWEDWTDGREGFNYTAMLRQSSFDPDFWNIFKNPRFADIGDPINASLAEATATGAAAYGKREVHFGGKQIIAWHAASAADWIVIAVVDSNKALAQQRQASRSVIAVSATLGAVVLISAAAVAVYAAVKRQYARLSNKVADLNVKLQRAEKLAGLVAARGSDAAAVLALSSGVDKVMQTLAGISLHPERRIEHEEVEMLQAAMALLLRRDFTVVKPQVSLTEDQQTLIKDCGMEVQATNTSDGGSRYNIPQNGTPSTVSLPPSVSVAKSLAKMGKIANLDSWGFNVFQVEHDQCESPAPGLLPLLAHGVLAAQRLLCISQTSFALPPVDEICYLEFAHQLQLGYAEFHNPYHNYMHAADVTQAMHVMLCMATETCPEFGRCLTPLDRLACIFAALMHDFKVCITLA
eukprot:TRINITY_DN4822_c0_g1_i2.p1 TRINITY_DN4822_c0_g1~~TRINITY_DN4822_c0_g1_i2.p1  ORF type:complete len:610 (+),score=133.23 TRINITY_DN4822_c0_g1_i2:438-2267(+)